MAAFRKVAAKLGKRDDILVRLRRRDEIDSHRQVSPLRLADDAVLLDTTDMGIEEVLARVEQLVEEQGCPPD